MRVLDRERRQPIKQAFAPRQFGDQHHAGEEEVDVAAFAHAIERVCLRQEAEDDERHGASDRPDRLRQVKGPDDDACRRDPSDDPRRDGSVGGDRQRILHVSGPATPRLFREARLTLPGRRGLAYCLRQVENGYNSGVIRTTCASSCAGGPTRRYLIRRIQDALDPLNPGSVRR